MSKSWTAAWTGLWGLGAFPVGGACGEAPDVDLPAGMPDVVCREGCGRGLREGVLEGSAEDAGAGRHLGGSADAKVEVQGTSNAALLQNDIHLMGGRVRKLGNGLRKEGGLLCSLA